MVLKMYASSVWVCHRADL